MIRRCCFASLVAAGADLDVHRQKSCCWLREPADPRKPQKRGLVMQFHHQNKQPCADILLTTTSCHMPKQAAVSKNMTLLFEKPKIDRSEIYFFKTTYSFPARFLWTAGALGEPRVAAELVHPGVGGSQHQRHHRVSGTS